MAVLVLFFLASGFVFQNGNILSRYDGFLLFFLFLVFLFYVFRQLKTDVSQQVVSKDELSNLQIWSCIIFGLAGLVFGGKLVVDNAIEIATNFGVSKKIMGLTI